MSNSYDPDPRPFVWPDMGPNISRPVLTLRGYRIHFLNEFDFWNVHGIMNTSGILQSNLIWASR